MIVRSGGAAPERAQPEAETVERGRALLDLATRAATAYDRPDLVDRLRTARTRLDDPRVRVLVVGEFKQGKSSLVNAVLGLEVCPIDDDVSTSVPTVVQWAPELTATAVSRAEPGAEPVRRVISIDDLPDAVTEAGNRGNEQDLALVEVGLPAALLEGGLALVDTPGVGGLGSVHSALTVATLPLADAVVFVTDAASELTEPELAFLRTVVSLCPRALVATTKTDIHPEWRKVHELDGIHLRDAGFELEQVALSSSLRELAIESGDRHVNDESGFPVLVRWLRDVVAAGVVGVDAAAAATLVAAVAAQLHDQLAGERDVLADPAAAEAVLAALGDAQARADRTRQVASRWQQVLADGFADATADIDRDLRTRLRNLASLAEDAIDELDPATAWAEFEPWLYQEVAGSLGEHLVLRHTQLARWVAAVAEAFGDDLGVDAGPGLDAGDAAAMLAATGRDAGLETSSMGLGSQVLSLLRSSYGGIAMFGVLGGIAGLVLSAPVTVGIGLLLGGKGLREEKARQLAQRRAQAKVSARQYLDAVSFTLANEQRDMLRITQRAVRDHYAAQANELHRAATAALDAARAARGADAAERSSRLAYLDAEIAKVAVVAQRAGALLEAAS